MPTRTSTTSTNEEDDLVLSYPGWIQDKATAEQYFALGGSSSNSNATTSNHQAQNLFDKKVLAMKHKQRIHQGDRSHPELVLLDNLEYTYPSFAHDQQEAFQIHTGDCSALYLGSFQDKLATMRRKQEIHTNRNAFAELRDLDALRFTYPGWRTDVRMAEGQWMEHGAQSQLFGKKVQAMQIKQALHEGDRSHPSLVALDTTTLTYKGWELDVQEALQRLTGDCSWLYLGEFDDKFQEMQRKQMAHEDRTNIAELQYLESLEFTYDHWQVDKASAERLYLEYDSSGHDSTASLFHKKVAGMQVKQMLHLGDRSHPDIRALDATQLTYPEADWDRQVAEQRITGDCSISRLGEFQQTLAELKNKQLLYTNRTNVTALQSLDNLLPPSQIAIPGSDNNNEVVTTTKSETDGTTSISSCSDEEEDEDEAPQTNNHKCVVCFDCDPTHAFIPCGHRCVCEGCVDLMDASQKEQQDDNKSCPLCRQPTVCVTRIFL